MKIRLRRIVAIDVDKTIDQSGVMIRFIMASESEAVVVIPPNLLPELVARLRAVTKGTRRKVTEQSNLKNRIRKFLSKGTRAA